MKVIADYDYIYNVIDYDYCNVSGFVRLSLGRYTSTQETNFMDNTLFTSGMNDEYRMKNE